MDTRTKILNSAQRLIQTRSFHGFSFQDVAEDVGIRKASLYHHFDSKDAVAIAVLDRAGAWVAEQLSGLDGLEAPTKLERYIDLYRQIHGKGERMCPGGSFAALIDAISPSLQRAMHGFTKLHLDWLEGVIREGIEGEQFEVGGQRPRDVAMQVLGSIQGALLVGRLTADPDTLDLAAAEIRRYLGYTPQSSH